MKRIGSVLLTLLSLTSCLGKPKEGLVRVQIDGPTQQEFDLAETMLKPFSAPSTTAGFDCLAVNVTGFQIPTMDYRYPPSLFYAMKDAQSPCMYPGITSTILPMPAAGTSVSVDLYVPRGFQDILQVLGLAKTGCAAQMITLGAALSTSAQPASDYSALYEVGRVNIDMNGPIEVNVPNTYTSANSTSRLANCYGGNTGGGSSPSPSPSVSPSASPSPSPTPGVFGYALAFFPPYINPVTITQQAVAGEYTIFTVEAFIILGEAPLVKGCIFERTFSGGMSTSLCINPDLTVSGSALSGSTCNSGSGLGSIGTSGVLALNTKYHIAFQVSPGSPLSLMSIYINGVGNNSSAFSASTATCTLLTTRIGSDGSSHFLPGVIDELRFSKVARYSSNFTPTATPFTNDTNTIILFHGDDVGVYSGTFSAATGYSAPAATFDFGTTATRAGYYVSPFP